MVRMFRSLILVSFFCSQVSYAQSEASTFKKCSIAFTSSSIVLALSVVGIVYSENSLECGYCCPNITSEIEECTPRESCLCDQAINPDQCSINETISYYNKTSKQLEPRAQFDLEQNRWVGSDSCFEKPSWALGIRITSYVFVSLSGIVMFFSGIPMVGLTYLAYTKHDPEEFFRVVSSRESSSDL